MFEDSCDLNEARVSSVSEIRVDVTDDEIKQLTGYFQKSREELQKKVDSLIEINLNNSKKANQTPVKEKEKKSSLKPTATDNEKSLVSKPIDLPTAIALREFTVGSCVHRFSDDWRRAKFIFRPEDSDLCYGLIGEKNGSRGLVMAVQAIILKNLILRGYKDIHGMPVTESESRNRRKILRPNMAEKRFVFVHSLAEILWVAGERKNACVVVAGQYNCFEIPTTNDRTTRNNYHGDGITERLVLYDFNDFKSLEEFINKNVSMYQKDDGCLLFLYSLILSRKFQRLREDLQGNVLIGDMEDVKLALYNLVLMGQATPFLHNLNSHYDHQGNSTAKALIGLKDRSDVGLLYWNSKEPENQRTEVGSMLKTPKYPIWLLLFGKNSIAIIFHTNIDLLNDWRLEKSFDLHFYSCLLKYDQQYKIKIDTRDNSNEILSLDKALKAKYPNFVFTDDEKETELEKIIHTKWPDCEIYDVDCKELITLL